MTVLPINVGEVHGGRIETDTGGLLNLVSNSGVNQYAFSWSTSLSALECFDMLDGRQLLKPFASQEFVSFAVGVEDLNGEWTTGFEPKSRPPYENLFRGALLRVPEENQVCARCELPGIAWVWLVKSPLQSGSEVKTFGVITEFLDETLVIEAFDLTASKDSHPLRGRLVAFANAAPDPEKIASVLKGLENEV